MHLEVQIKIERREEAFAEVKEQEDYECLVFNDTLIFYFTIFQTLF